MIGSFLWQSRSTAVVRPARLADAARIATLHASAFARGWSQLDIEAMLIDGAVIGHVIGPGGAKAPADGFILSRIVAGEAEVLSIAVDPARRGEGLSRALLRQHMGALADSGARVLHLEVEDGNRPALALYARDFRVVGRREAYYRRPDGSAAAAILMRAELGR
jgi:ribosomal-protein-alanine N-acetyltransferase